MNGRIGPSRHLGGNTLYKSTETPRIVLWRELDFCFTSLPCVFPSQEILGKLSDSRAGDEDGGAWGNDPWGLSVEPSCSSLEE